MLPSEVKMKSYSGYRRDVFEGWKKMPDAAIIGDGYTVEFSRLSERTIDMMCDSLNGWFNVWTKYLCEYTDKQGTLAIIVRKPKDADKLFNMFSDIRPVEFEHERITPAANVARTKMETLIDLIRRKEPVCIS